MPFILSCWHSVLILSLFCVLLIATSMVLGLITKKSVWQLIAHAGVEKTKEKKTKKYYLIGLLVVVLGALLDQSIKEGMIYAKEKTLFSNTRIALPHSIPVKREYINDINRCKQDPVAYVMQLFEENDIVILAERLHPEYTQWQLFSQLIFNDAFAEKVGNVCTEFGLVHYQADLEQYLNNHFDATEELKKATAGIVRENGGLWPLWVNKNIYDFVLNLHEYNAQKDSSHKINLFFSDAAMSWQGITNNEQWRKAFYGIERDSLMACNVMATYNRLQTDNAARKKMLVIMNTRHSFNGVMGDIDPSVADYVFKAFPSKTANVLINGTTQLATPMRLGLWDEIALCIPDSSWAISFDDCILGNDFFDLFPVNPKNRKYKEVFNGMIYHRHPQDFHIVTGYDYMLDGFKDTLLHRSAIVGDDYLQGMMRSIETYEKYTSIKDSVPFFMLFNFVFLSLHYLILFFLLVNLIVISAVRRLHGVVHENG
jgi:hypothetical protein